MEDYCKIYMTSAVSTLLNIVCKNTDKIFLDFGYNFSTPHLMMDLILKISVEEIYLIIDVDQNFFVERSMRGGVCFLLGSYPRNKSDWKNHR